MPIKNISLMTDDELRSYIESILNQELLLDWLHDDIPANRIIALYHTQTEENQRIRIRAAINWALLETFIAHPHDRLDAKLDELLADLAFLCESLKIDQSYRPLRALLDRGSLVGGDNFFYDKNTERLILRAIAVLQPAKMFVESVWELYWQAEDAFFWDVAFFGVRRADFRHAVRLLPEGYRRWKMGIDFDFPEALTQTIASAKTRSDRSEIMNSLREIPPEDVLRIQELLEAKGLGPSVLDLALPPVYTFETIKSHRGKIPFHIYYHRDLDGIGCAVSLTLFFAKEYGWPTRDIVTIPVEYGKSNWPDYKIRQPAAILDFLYHPKTLIYYDHHVAPFVSPEFEQSFLLRENRQLFRWEKGGSSATKLMFSDLRTWFERHFAEGVKAIPQFVEQIDKIDSARYDSVDEWLESDLPFMQLNRILHYLGGTDAFCNKLVQDLVHKDVAAVLSEPYYQDALRKLTQATDRQVLAVKEILESANNVILYDSAKPPGAPSFDKFRFLPYKFFPEAFFVVGIYIKGKVSFGVSVGRNPWNPRVPDINLGQLCAKFGGGGHKDVGGVTVNKYQDATVTSRDIIDVLHELN